MQVVTKAEKRFSHLQARQLHGMQMIHFAAAAAAADDDDDDDDS